MKKPPFNLENTITPEEVSTCKACAIIKLIAWAFVLTVSFLAVPVLYWLYTLYFVLF